MSSQELDYSPEPVLPHNWQPSPPAIRRSAIAQLLSILRGGHGQGHTQSDHQVMTLIEMVVDRPRKG